MSEDQPARKRRTPEVTTTIRLPIDVYEQVQDLAHEERISMAEFIRQALSDRLATLRSKRNPPAEYAAA